MGYRDGKGAASFADTASHWSRGSATMGLLKLHHGTEDLIISGNDCGVYSCHQALRRDAFIAAGGYNPENTAGEWIGDGETG